MGKNKKGSTAKKSIRQENVEKSSGGFKASKSPTISLCMMVKNEENRLPTALKSAKPWVDEIIVVDTGSTDRTVEIAEEFGAKVYHHPWENSFSVHRNQSIAHASGDWILILDADEELDQETVPQIRELVTAQPGIDGFLFELNNKTPVGGDTFILHARLFRKLPGLRYDGQVHNRPIVPGNIYRSNIRLFHYGYDETPEVMEAKHQRRINMISKWVEEEPENFQAHSYLAHTYGSRPETMDQALEHAQTALELAKSQSAETKFFPHIYYGILTALGALGRGDEVIERADEIIKLVPSYPDPYYYTASIYYKLKDWEKVRGDARKFMDLQDQCRLHPDQFIFFENMTVNQTNLILFYWVIATANLDLTNEFMEAYERMFQEHDAANATRRVTEYLLLNGLSELGVRTSQLALEKHPQWPWPEKLGRLAAEKRDEENAKAKRDEGLEALQNGDFLQAAELLKQAVDLSPTDAEALLNLGRALEEKGRIQEAQTWYMRGLNANPHLAWAWKRLADSLFSQEDYQGALACYQRYLGVEYKNEEVQSRISVCERRTTRSKSTVAEAPPKLVVFLVSGLTAEMVQLSAPHIFMGKAWGEILQSDQQTRELQAWANIYTATGPEIHGFSREITRGEPLGLQDLKVPSLWELLPPEVSLGLAAIPLGHPVPKLPGWALAGHPAGLLQPDMVHPPELAPRVLAGGYRADFILTDFEEQTFTHNLENNIRKEAFLFQMERNKLTCAMNLPAVEVLVFGLRHLELMQQVYDRATYNVFNAYIQTFGWIETLLAALKPGNFAILSQRQYSQRNKQPIPGGFYCLSWLKGENDKAYSQDLAPEILKLMGGDPARLGKPR